MVLGVLALALGATYWVAQVRAKETIAKHREIFAREREALQAKPRGREALLLSAQPGTAEEVRDAFFAALAAVPADEMERVGRYDPSAEEIEEEERVLAAHPEVVATLEPLLHVPSRPPPPPVTVHQEAPFRLKDIGRASEWLAAAGKRALRRGDRSEALRLALRSYALGGDVARAGPIVCFMMGSAIQQTALDHLRDALAAGSSVEDVRSAVAVLDAVESSRARVAEAVEFDGAAFRGSFSEIEGDALIRAGWRYLWSFRIFLASSLDAWDGVSPRLLAIAVSAEADGLGAVADAKRLSAEQEKGSLEGLVVVVVPHVLRRDVELRAARTVARTALAVALHRADGGTGPATLAELVPKHLPRVPVDPLNGKPLRWSPEAGVVWSVGRDGDDDGGVPIDPESDADAGDISWSIGARR